MPMRPFSRLRDRTGGYSPLVALQRGDFKLDTDVVKKERASAIRCPHCGWQPERSSRWYCLPCDHPEYFTAGCGTAWNTFDTKGLCPGCAYQWKHTSCLACTRWSRHEDWYTDGPGGTNGQR
jgi:hypothetical protein